MASGSPLRWDSTTTMLGCVSFSSLRSYRMLMGLPAASAATAITAANLFVSLGLKAVGYEYINTDDTWSQKSRVNGLLTPDASKWPNGIAAVATEIHGKGLKMGISQRSRFGSSLLSCFCRFVWRFRVTNLFRLPWIWGLRDYGCKNHRWMGHRPLEI